MVREIPAQRRKESTAELRETHRHILHLLYGHVIVHTYTWLGVNCWDDAWPMGPGYPRAVLNVVFAEEFAAPLRSV